MSLINDRFGIDKNIDDLWPGPINEAGWHFFDLWDDLVSSKLFPATVLTIIVYSQGFHPLQHPLLEDVVKYVNARLKMELKAEGEGYFTDFDTGERGIIPMFTYVYGAVIVSIYLIRCFKFALSRFVIYS